MLARLTLADGKGSWNKCMHQSLGSYAGKGTWIQHWTNMTRLFSQQCEILDNIELVEELICSRESALHVNKSTFETERKTGISQPSVRLKTCKNLSMSTLTWFARRRHIILHNLIQINYDLTLIMKRLWVVPNLVQIWSVLLKLQT